MAFYEWTSWAVDPDNPDNVVVVGVEEELAIREQSSLPSSATSATIHAISDDPNIAEFAMDVGSDLPLQWVEEVGNVIHEEVICGLDSELDVPEEEVQACEEVAIEETVESVIDHHHHHQNINHSHSQHQQHHHHHDSMADDCPEILMVPQHSSDMESIYIVPQDHQGHDYLNIQVTEEVITDNWDRGGPDDGVDVPETKVSHDNLLEYDDMEIPLPIDQDSYTNTRPYPCDFCSRRFRKKANLMNHMVAHQTDRPHGCNLCGARYVRKCDLVNHLKIHAYAPSRDGLEDDMNDDDPLATEDEEPNKIRRKKVTPSVPRKRKLQTGGRKRANDDANMVNARWTDQMGMMDQQVPRWPVTDSSKPYVCQTCGVGFAREKALASHVRIHGGDSPFECTNCPEVFWDINTLQDHMRLKHGLGLLASTDQDDIDHETSYSANDTIGEYFCETCGVPFHRLDLLKKHRRIHIKQEVDVMEGSSQNHVCTTCGEWFTEALELLAHAELHASRSPSRRCLLCGQRCRDDAEVAEHVREMHGDNAPPNTCVLCGKTCKDKKSLLKHSWIHNNEKTFACTKCGKRFHSKARLRRHMMSHRNKMVVCEECGEEFPDGRALVSHRHSHNKELGGRTFPCRECGKTFGSRSSQQIHIRIHTGERPYGCRFCWKAFADGGTLRKHERIHTGEKPYGCAICPRAFNQRVVLREHVRAHHSGPDPKCQNSLTPYLCKVCGETYSTSEEIVAHIVQHCDENTALRRQPQTGPRKYKRRRKLKHEEPAVINPTFNFMDGIVSDSDDNKRKISKKSKQYRTNVEESYQSVLKSFESSLQNIDSIVNNSKSSSKQKLGRKKGKKEEKKNDLPSTSNVGRPKMIHTQKTRVPVEIGSEGVKRGQKTKTMVTRTPKVMPNEQRVNTGERNRPRTKNVSYHVEGRQQFMQATFAAKHADLNPKNSISENMNIMPRQMELINVKIEPGLHKICKEEIVNNTDLLNVLNDHLEEEPPVPKQRTPVKRIRKPRITTPKSKPKEKQAEAMLELPTNNNVDMVQENQLFESVMGSGHLEEEVPFESDVPNSDAVQESILPDLDKAMNQVDNIHEGNQVKLSVKVEPANDGILDVHNLIGAVEEVPETIIPDALEYTCEMCLAVFASRAELLVHVPIHI